MLSTARAFSIISLLLLSIGSVSANNFPYNALDFRVGAGPATFGAAYSMQFMENAHFIIRADSEFEGDYDFAGGVGFNGPVNQFVDVTGQMLIHNIKDDSSNIIGDDILPEFNVGTRIWFLDNVELQGKIGWLVDDNENHLVWEAGARFHSTQQLVLGASLLDNGVYGSQMMIHTRFHF
ncbi:hypothetical protein L3V77_18000 [Vibrio sp. DW001]|uniref:hypothetical protein n=1 Tax=unclassified Vibrio TaxID=2614977 RepID=UPI00189E8387|nr:MULTISPECIES: hypothetical protein [unclassified Vibrio]UGA57029.1 hypothetical protein IUZ65_022855 [Vibrio sp. VB16]WED29323.1 hypothetical protein L3V77_18000 [Vibrio sp. DW001]